MYTDETKHKSLDETLEIIKASGHLRSHEVEFEPTVLFLQRLFSTPERFRTKDALIKIVYKLL